MFFESLWFLLPMLMANQCPGFAVYLNLPFAHTPVAGKLLGKNKTIGAYYVAPLGAIATLYLQRQTELSSVIGLFDYNRSDLWLAGLMIGLGVAVGDHLKSFIKRRIGIPPGARWWPFDQLDFVVGGVIFAIPVVGWIGWTRTTIICLLVLLIHPLGNRLGYMLGLRKVPY